MKKIDLSEPPRIDIGEEIRARVTMEDVARHYTGADLVKGRMSCPFHHGRDRNLALYRNGYKCYVCGASGDQVSFVMGLTGLDFAGAAADIDRAFGLGLPVGERRGSVDPALLREAALRAERRRLADLWEREAMEDLELLWDVWCLCDRVLRERDPSDPRYTLAAMWIDWVAYQIDIQEEEVWERQHMKTS